MKPLLLAIVICFVGCKNPKNIPVHKIEQVASNPLAKQYSATEILKKQDHLDSMLTKTSLALDAYNKNRDFYIKAVSFKHRYECSGVFKYKRLYKKYADSTNYYAKQIEIILK